MYVFNGVLSKEELNKLEKIVRKEFKRTGKENMFIEQTFPDHIDIDLEDNHYITVFRKEEMKKLLFLNKELLRDLKKENYSDNVKKEILMLVNVIDWALGRQRSLAEEKDTVKLKYYEVRRAEECAVFKNRYLKAPKEEVRKRKERAGYHT